MSNKIIVQPSFQREAKRMAKHYRSFKMIMNLLFRNWNKTLISAQT